MKLIPPLLVLLLTACVEPTPSAAPDAGRPMDEVPVEQRLSNGDREYGFANGCVIVLQPDRAVTKTESAECEPYHRDIALLYAAAD